MDFLKTGIRGLDALLGGGIPSGAKVLLYGHPLSGKKPVAMSFLFQGLVEGMPAILVLTDHSYEEWKKMMGWSGWKIEEFEKKGLLRCIDASQRGHQAEELPEFVVKPENPEALNSLSIALSNAAAGLPEKKPLRVVFHSLSTLLEKNDAPIVYRFLQFLSSKLAAMNATVIYSLDMGMFDEKDIATMEHLADGVIELGENRLRVRGFLESATNDWVAFSSKKGFVSVGRRSRRASGRGMTEPIKLKQKHARRTGKKTHKQGRAKKALPKKVERARGRKRSKLRGGLKQKHALGTRKKKHKQAGKKKARLKKAKRAGGKRSKLRREVKHVHARVARKKPRKQEARKKKVRPKKAKKRGSR